MNTTVPSSNVLPLNLGVSGFMPWYTPVELLTMGVYGGAYFFNVGSRSFINPEFFDALDKSKYAQKSPDVLLNKFQVGGSTLRFGIDFSILAKQKNPYGFFQWYSKLWSSKTYNNLVGWDKTFDKDWVHMWQSSINAMWYYIASTEYTGIDDRFTDLTFLPEIRQTLLEYGWDPTKNPSTYGIY